MVSYIISCQEFTRRISHGTEKVEPPKLAPILARAHGFHGIQNVLIMR